MHDATVKSKIHRATVTQADLDDVDLALVW